jgi:hypothetical protein
LKNTFQQLHSVFLPFFFAEKDGDESKQYENDKDKEKQKK